METLHDIVLRDARAARHAARHALDAIERGGEIAEGFSRREAIELLELTIRTSDALIERLSDAAAAL